MIRININKAKAIAHNLRREERSKEFSPHDKAIAAQIPGLDFTKEEAARAAIRSKYEQIQIDIDAANSPEEIKQALVNIEK